jgi:hypothetical protein
MKFEWLWKKHLKKWEKNENYLDFWIFKIELVYRTHLSVDSIGRLGLRHTWNLIESLELFGIQRIIKRNLPVSCWTATLWSRTTPSPITTSTLSSPSRPSHCTTITTTGHTSSRHCSWRRCSRRSSISRSIRRWGNRTRHIRTRVVMTLLEIERNFRF